jgi:spore maturation protein CgeB
VLRILFVGPLRHGSTTLQRLTAMADLGHQIQSIDTYAPSRPFDPATLAARALVRAYRAGSPIRPRYTDRSRANNAILRALRQQPRDVLWVEKGLTIEASTLAEAKHTCPATRIVGYSPDDMAARHNHSRQFLEHLNLYDLFFTTKSYNVSELKALGCPDVRFVDNAFDPHTHRPLSLAAEARALLGGPIGFIGSYEMERAQSLAHLARSGLVARIYGGNWTGQRIVKRSGLRSEGRTLVADDYARAICAFDVNLHFLRKANRDQQTTRSIEIPACGGFMLAERTDEHESLFEDGREAVFFGSDDELLDRVRYYVRQPDECIRIARAGRQRCETGGYSNQHRLDRMLAAVGRLQ